MKAAKTKQSTKIRRGSRPMKTEAQKLAELARSVGVLEAQIPKLSMGKVVDLSGELGKKMSVVKVLVNREGPRLSVGSQRIGPDRSTSRNSVLSTTRSRSGRVRRTSYAQSTTPVTLWISRWWECRSRRRWTSSAD